MARGYSQSDRQNATRRGSTATKHRAEPPGTIPQTIKFPSTSVAQSCGCCRSETAHPAISNGSRTTRCHCFAENVTTTADKTYLLDEQFPIWQSGQFHLHPHVSNGLNKNRCGLVVTLHSEPTLQSLYRYTLFESFIICRPSPLFLPSSLSLSFLCSRSHYFQNHSFLHQYHYENLLIARIPLSSSTRFSAFR